VARILNRELMNTMFPTVSRPSAASSHGASPNRARDFAQTAKKSAHPRVLVVDDESLMRWSVAETLGASGYDVAEAEDAAGALQAVSKPASKTAAVLLDLRLPDSNDLGVLSAIRRLSPDTAVIMMTAHETPELGDQALKLGAFAVLHKPFEMGDLGQLVQRALAAHAG
jgi:two-component system C4-dicarboxylate transport response regulator DctD